MTAALPPVVAAYRVSRPPMENATMATLPGPPASAEAWATQWM